MNFESKKGENTINDSIERFSDKNKDTLKQESVDFEKKLAERIPQMRNFYIKYFSSLGIDPEKNKDFDDSETGSIAEWFDDISTYYLKSIEDSEVVNLNQEFAGVGHALQRWALISKRQMEKLEQVDHINFFAPAALAHEIYHALAAVSFVAKEDVPIDENLRWFKRKCSGAVYADWPEIKIDLDEEGTPVAKNGYWIIDGDQSIYRKEDYLSFKKKGESRGTLYRYGNLLEEGLATIIELRFRDEIAPDYPDVSEKTETAIQIYLKKHPEEPQFREGLHYTERGFDDIEGFDPETKILPSKVYRKGVQLFRMLSDEFEKKHSDSMYFERMFQKARVLAEHDRLWQEVSDLLGKELADKVKYVNDGNIDNVINEVRDTLANNQ
jgi:hypothetical protein